MKCQFYFLSYVDDILVVCRYVHRNSTHTHTHMHTHTYTYTYTHTHTYIYTHTHTCTHTHTHTHTQSIERVKNKITEENSASIIP